MSIKQINFIIACVFFVCYAYQFIYIPISWRGRRTAHKPPKLHRFAVLIAARNEEAVISELIDSINAQDYPSGLIDIYVAADNCTDGTAKTARCHGAQVFERFDTQHVGKGYALDFLLSHIPHEYDAYLVLDADNVIAPDYIRHMDQTLSDGYKIATSYRNSKNYGDNWISAGYALWFLRESRYLNGARYTIGSSCAVSGTGFAFTREILDRIGSWHFFLLTEDIEFTIDNVVHGEKIGYCREAVLYDEQPTDFRQSVRQRLRWAKGYIQVFRRYGAQLLRGTAKGSWSCFDMSMSILPAFILTALCLLANLTLTVLGLAQGDGAWFALRSLLECMGSVLATLLVLGGITTASEWRRIYAPGWKKILYTLTFPLFMLTYLPISMAALFMKVEWKPIHHGVKLAGLPTAVEPR